MPLSNTVPLPSGRAIPSLGFGVYQIRPAETKAAVLDALRIGYRHIDTAQLYQNEKEVGQAIKESGIPREQIYLTTKFISQDMSYDNATKAINDSLERLAIDSIDLYLIHEPIVGPEGRMAMWKALVDAKKAGKVKDIGVSNYGVKHLEEIKAAGLELPAVNQVELHPLDQQRPIVEWCKKHGVVMEAYCPLIRGQFDIPILQDMVKKYKKDPAQILVRWSLQKGFIPLPRSTKQERIRSNADVYDFEMSDEDIARIDTLDQGAYGAISWNPVYSH